MRSIGKFLSGVLRVGRQSASIENPATPLSDPDDFVFESFGAGRGTDSGVKISEKKALGYSPLWRGINLIADDVMKLGLHVYRRVDGDGREKDLSHAAWRLVRRKPNAVMTAATFWNTITLHMLLHGNGYAYIVRDGKGEPLELLLLDPCGTYPVRQIVGDSIDLYYVTAIGGEQLKIRAEDVLHLKRLSRDGLVGLSVLELMRESIGLGIAARTFGAKFFGQGANASGILMIPGHLKTAAQENVLRKWASMAEGLSKAHKVALIQDNVKFQQLTITPEQGQFLQTREFEIRVVSQILGIPPHKLGDSSRTSYNSLEQENRSYLDESLDPWLVRIEEECNDKLLTEVEKESESHFFEFNRAALLRTDARTRAEIQSRTAFMYTVNEFRAQDNKPPIDGGDVRYVPTNWQAAGKDAPPTPIKEKKKPAENQVPAVEAAVRQSHADLLLDLVGRAIEIEGSEAIAAAGRAGNFVEWAERFYAKHESRMLRGLKPALRAWYAVSSKTGADADAEAFCKTYCSDARQSLLAAAEVAPGQLVESVSRFVAARRFDVTKLMGA
jgi:HK97 family phage portal protein